MYTFTVVPKDPEDPMFIFSKVLQDTHQKLVSVVFGAHHAGLPTAISVDWANPGPGYVFSFQVNEITEQFIGNSLLKLARELSQTHPAYTFFAS